MGRFVFEGKEIFDKQLGRYLTSTEAWQLRKSLQLMRLKRDLPKAQAEGQEYHAIMQKMMNDLVQNRQIPNRRYSYDEMHQILDARKAQRQAKQAPPKRQASGGTYFVVVMIAIVVLFLYWWFTRGG